jgi:6-phosphogluconolactonase
MSQIEVFPNPEALARATAERIVALAAEAVVARGRFSIGLSGGSTPRALFTLLAGDDFATRIDWLNAHIFWGDERCVAPDHAESNYRMARETLLDRVPVQPEHIYRMRGEIEPAQAAAEYEQTLRLFFAGEMPRFDLLLLGLGDDGHTASLFPGTRALQEQERWVIANYVPKFAAWRLTLTAVAINAAAHVMFLVAGQSKAPILRDVIKGPRQPDRYPAQLVQPRNVPALWLADEAAASLL